MPSFSLAATAGGRRSRAGCVALATALFVASCGLPDTVTRLPDVAGAGSAEPHLSTTINGRAVLSWLEPDGDESVLKYSTLDGGTWSKPAMIASGNDWFVNWADFPSVVPVTPSLWAAHWLRKRPGNTYSYDVVISLSTDGGETWGQPLTPHDDDTPTEHGFVSLFPWLDGIGTLWLDGRNTLATGREDRLHGMTLRSAIIGADGTVDRPQLVDSLVCDCCQTDVAIARDGPVAVYRNRTDAEIRDIYVARSSGGKWAEGIPVADDGWQIAGCPVNGPAIAARTDDVAVAWFTAAGDSPRVRVAFSSDGGRSFEMPIDVDAAGPVGRVGIVHLGDDDVLVSWLAAADGGSAHVRALRVSATGERGEPVTVARTAAGRMSGFPQVATRGDDIVFAWTDATDAGTTVRSAVAPRRLF